MALPWKERVNMLSINPDAASRKDVADMAADLGEFFRVSSLVLEVGSPFYPGAVSDQEARNQLRDLIEKYERKKK